MKRLRNGAPPLRRARGRGVPVSPSHAAPPRPSPPPSLPPPGAVFSFRGTRFTTPAATHLYVDYLDGYLMAGYQLVITSDADPAVTQPPGYAWPAAAPYGGAARGGGGEAGAGGLPPRAQYALIATLTFAAASAAALGAFLLAGAFGRRRAAARAAADAAAALATGGGKLSEGGGSAVGSGPGPLLPHVTAVKAHPRASSSGGSSSHGSSGGTSPSSGSGADALAAAAAAAAAKAPSAPRPAQELLVAISSRVTDIQAKRLAARSPGQSGPQSGPQPGLGRASAVSSGSGGDGSSRGGSGGGALSGSSSPSRAACTARPRTQWEAGGHLSGSGAAEVEAEEPGSAGGSSGSPPPRRSADSGSASAAAAAALARRPGPPGLRPQQLQILETLGSGTFGTVFRARWHSSEVAVKLVQLPATALGGSPAPLGGPGDAAVAAAASARVRERMAVQEAAISTAMTHPNIVALYCVGLRPVHAAASPRGSGSAGAAATAGAAAGAAADGGVEGGEAQGPRAGTIVSWELQLSEWPAELGRARRSKQVDRPCLLTPRAGP
jgi:hypothetical protein